MDGITKFVENHNFNFDNVFCEKEDTETLYKYSLRPLVELLVNKGVLTVFAYG